MKLIDLTYPMEETYKNKPAVIPSFFPLKIKGKPYSAVIYDFNWGGMMGSYIDFPGHIKETDDGVDAFRAPLENLYELPAAVIHLKREGTPGPISAKELEETRVKVPRGGGLIVNALGKKRFNEVPPNSVYFGRDAIKWIVGTKIKLILNIQKEKKK